MDGWKDERAERQRFITRNWLAHVRGAQASLQAAGQAGCQEGQAGTLGHWVRLQSTGRLCSSQESPLCP